MEISNIILIAIDTLRADHLSCYNYKRNTSPNIDEFAKKSMLFKNAYSVSSWTSPAFASLFSSVLPSEHTVLKYPRPKSLRKGLPTITQILTKSGFITAGFHGGGFVSSKFGFAKGFKIYDSQGMLLKDNLDLCLKFIGENKRRKKFVFFHGYECHRPYEPENRFDCFLGNNNSPYDVSKLLMPGGKRPKAKQDFEKIVAKYDGCIKMADYYTGKLLTYLEANGYFNNSIIIILSDHGEEFREHGGFDHIRTLYEEVVRIPLFLYVPGTTPKLITQKKSILDVGPTLAELLALKFDQKEGLSLLNSQPSRPIFLETGLNSDYIQKRGPKNHPGVLRAVIKDEYKIILDAQVNPTELYDLQKDSKEQKNILHTAQSRQIRQSLMETAKAKQVFARTKSQDLEPVKFQYLEEKIKHRLRSLGYF